MKIHGLDETMMGRFDRIRLPVDGGLRAALADVLDVAEHVGVWFQDRGLQATAADLVELTQIVLARDAQQAKLLRTGDMDCN